MTTFDINHHNSLTTGHVKVKDTPSYSLGSRPKDAKKYVTPAPGAYESCDTRYRISTRYGPYRVSK